MPETVQKFYFDTALLPSGWAQAVCIGVSSAGDILEVEAGADPSGAQVLGGALLPGMPNLHSHAFQRALAGLAEFQTDSKDSFWTWRNKMYEFVARIEPEHLETIAAQLYMEMLKSGFTSVAEFHYLHHARGGQVYDDPARMSLAIIAAAKRCGIGLTHLPVLYMTSGFGAKPALEKQARFINDEENFISLISRLHADYNLNSQVRIGLALHSLRAVPPSSLEAVVSAYNALDPNGPIHIHIAEQVQEVEDCIAFTGMRPVEWLLHHTKIDSRWCLVHATHLQDAERDALADAGAVVGLCPTTEANLGDGLFPLKEYIARQGCFGIGSDSNSSVSPLEELRWLEYGQRLRRQARNIATTEAVPHCGRLLWQDAVAGGARALARKTGKLAPGYRADMLVVDREHSNILGRDGDLLLDSLLFSGNSNPIRDVMAGGKWVVRDGKHRKEDEIKSAYADLIKNNGLC